MDAITTEQMLKFINEIHEYLRSGDGDWSIDIDSPEVGIIKAIRAALDERDALTRRAEALDMNLCSWMDAHKEVTAERDALKAEVVRLATEASHHQHDAFYAEQRAEKSEAELAAARGERKPGTLGYHDVEQFYQDEDGDPTGASAGPSPALTSGGEGSTPSPGSITAEGYNPALSGQGLISREDEAALAEINKGLSYEENFRDYDAEEKALAHIKARLAALPDAPKGDK